MKVQASLDKKQDPISEITTVKSTADMTQVVEHLPSKAQNP
jgi:hypothetical protein